MSVHRSALRVRPVGEILEPVAHLARAAVRDGRIDTHNFRLMKVTDYTLVEELEKIAATPLTTEAREHLDDYYGYQARALKNGHDQALLICPMGEKNLAVTVVEKDDPNGFVVRKTGPYFYVPFFAMMSAYGIDCAEVRVAYDIIKLQENHNGNPVFGFFRTEC